MHMPERSFRKKHLFLAIRFLLSIIFLSAFTIGANEQGPDIATFLKIGRNFDARYNQANGDIYFVSAMSGTDQLYRLNSNGWPYQLTVFDNGLEWYEISHDGTRIVVGASSGGDEQTQLYLLDTNSDQLSALTDNPKTKYSSVFWSNDDKGLYYGSNSENLKDIKIYYYNLIAKEETKLLDMDGSNFIGDISLDGRYMIIIHMESNISNDLYLFDLLTGESRLVASGLNGVSHSEPFIAGNDKTVFVICNRDSDGIMKLAKINTASRNIEFVDPESELMVELLALSEDRRYMIYLENEDGYSKINLRDIEDNKKLPVPDLKGRITDPDFFEGGRLLFTFDNPMRTSDIWEWNWANSDLKQKTFAIYAGINRNSFVEPKLIKYKSFDGLEIPAFLYLPPDYNNEPIPFIMRIHGGPAEQFRPYFVRNFQYFILNGFGLLVPNIRGSLGYGKEYANLDNYKNRMDAIKDIKAGADYLLENGFTEKGKLGIMGPSYGGFAVLASIIEYPDYFAAAIDRNGISNFVTYLKNTKAYRSELRETEYGPLSDEEFLESISPLNKAYLIRTPLMVVHGENDTRVPIGEARQIIRAINDNNGIVDSLIFPDEGHIISKQSNRILLYRKVVEFFDKYLK